MLKQIKLQGQFQDAPTTKQSFITPPNEDKGTYEKIIGSEYFKYESSYDTKISFKEDSHSLKVNNNIELQIPSSFDIDIKLTGDVVYKVKYENGETKEFSKAFTEYNKIVLSYSQENGYSAITVNRDGYLNYSKEKIRHERNDGRVNGLEGALTPFHSLEADLGFAKINPEIDSDEMHLFAVMFSNTDPLYLKLYRESPTERDKEMTKELAKYMLLKLYSGNYVKDEKFNSEKFKDSAAELVYNTLFFKGDALNSSFGLVKELNLEPFVEQLENTFGNRNIQQQQSAPEKTNPLNNPTQDENLQNSPENGDKKPKKGKPNKKDTGNINIDFGEMLREEGLNLAGIKQTNYPATRGNSGIEDDGNYKS